MKKEFTQMDKWALESARGLLQGKKEIARTPSIGEYNAAISANKYIGVRIIPHAS